MDIVGGIASDGDRVPRGQSRACSLVVPQALSVEAVEAERGRHEKDAEQHPTRAETFGHPAYRTSIGSRSIRSPISSPPAVRTGSRCPVSKRYIPTSRE